MIEPSRLAAPAPVGHEPARGVPTPPRGADADGADLSRLVAAARLGDRSAFEQLVEATYRDTYTLALRLTRHPDDARDVTQEAYLRAHRAIEGFRGDAQFTTWLYRITANCASTHLRRRRRHRHEPLPSATEPADERPDGDPQLRADAADVRDRLLVALDRLPPKLRSVVVLRDVYELSHDAIATELGISATAAKVRLHRARLKLRAEVFPELDEVDARAL
jgi:RNA polymerase sigma-70 factor (ECF subfamily)